MIRLVKSLVRLETTLANICATPAFGRKVATVDQRRHWSERARQWRREQEGAAQDPYYTRLDALLLSTLASFDGAERFVEVGCFFGGRLAKAQAALPRAMIAGLDVVFDGLQVAQACGARWLINGDATRLPLRSGAVDCVYTCVCLTHIPERDIGTALDELIRVTSRYLVLIEVYDQFMARRRRWRVWAWTAGYCHPYARLLARRPLVPIRVEGLKDDTGHPRFTLFVYRKGRL